MSQTTKSQEFDAEYFHRFYESAKTRVYGPKEIAHLACGITQLIQWFGGPLRNVLDVGAGTGLWRDWFATNMPQVRYRSTDVSSYACEKYGHELRDIATWRSKQRFDLVVCQGVLPYLSDENADRALSNLAAMTRGFLYLEAITARDLHDVCNSDATDNQISLRTGAWYWSRLVRLFVPVGCGLFYNREGSLSFYELESLSTNLVEPAIKTPEPRI